MIRAHAQVRAALLFKLAAEQQIGSSVSPSLSSSDYSISLEQLASLTRDQNLSSLQQHGGGKGLPNLLKTSTEKGISGDETDLLNRRNAFGSNTFPRKKGRSFLVQTCSPFASGFFLSLFSKFKLEAKPSHILLH
ncbi:hypothetical protein IC582_021085 [Cucumis melo]